MPVGPLAGEFVRLRRPGKLIVVNQALFFFLKAAGLGYQVIPDL